MNGQSELQDIQEIQLAKAIFNDLIINPITNLSTQVTQENIDQTISATVLFVNQRYGIDASLFSDIGFIIINVLSNCIGY